MSQQPLWAPWRVEYIRSEKAQGCIFCQFPAEPPANDRANLVVRRTGRTFSVLNRFPYNSGHLMVIPRAHVNDPGLLGAEDWAALQDELRLAISVVREVYRPEGVNVGMNLGLPAGAGIADHMHWHVVPRWIGDNNFMPVLADQRVVVEALDAAWVNLSAGFAGR